jgi:hypothetical protein
LNNEDWWKTELTVFDLEGVVSFAAFIFAAFLAAISYLTYRRNKSSRLLFVVAAFSLFAFKEGLFTINEFIFESYLSFEWVSILLDFGVLFLFFVGMLKK